MFPDENKNRRILEFQSRLLHELSLAPEPSMSKDSRFKNITAAAREIMDVYFLDTYQQKSGDKHKLKFFWANTPSEPSQEIALQAVRDALCPALSLSSGEEDCPAVHTIAVPDSVLPDFPHASLDLRSKSFPFDALGFTGRVGIGLAKTHAGPGDAIAVESLFVALLNLVGTAKTSIRYSLEVERFAPRDPLTNLCRHPFRPGLLHQKTVSRPVLIKRRRSLFSSFPPVSVHGILFGLDRKRRRYRQEKECSVGRAYVC